MKNIFVICVTFLIINQIDSFGIRQILINKKNSFPHCSVFQLAKCVEQYNKEVNIETVRTIRNEILNDKGNKNYNEVKKCNIDSHCAVETIIISEY